MFSCACMSAYLSLASKHCRKNMHNDFPRYLSVFSEWFSSLSDIYIAISYFTYKDLQLFRVKCILAASAKLRIIFVSFVTSVFFFHIYHLGSHWTDLCDILYCRLLWIYVQKIQIWLQSGKNFGHFTCWFYIVDSDTHGLSAIQKKDRCCSCHLVTK
jgi:hypothetical protein